MKINEQGLKILKTSEGLKLKKYKCPAGHWTIGYGHKILPGEDLEEITLEQAEKLLESDLKEVEEPLTKLLPFITNSNMFSALVDFCFNLGIACLLKSTMYLKLRSGDFDVAKEFLKYNKARQNGKLEVMKGLSDRREKDALLYATGLVELQKESYVPLNKI